MAYSGIQIPRMLVYPRPSVETHNPKIPNYGPAFNPFMDKYLLSKALSLTVTLLEGAPKCYALQDGDEKRAGIQR